MFLVYVHFEGNEEAPAELAPGEAVKENNSAESCQLSSEMKGEDLLSVLSWLLLFFICDFNSQVSQTTWKNMFTM